jgi:anti-sigma factor ChrR (cupin superfamily)
MAPVMAPPLRTNELPWMPLAPGMSARFLRFDGDERSLQLRIQPGTVIPRHRHGGSVNAYNLQGHRWLGDGSIAGPGDYVYEPAGNIDSWGCHGDEPCIVQISMSGSLEYLDEEDRVISSADTAKLRAAYLDWCAREGHEPMAIGARG